MHTENQYFARDHVNVNIGTSKEENKNKYQNQ